MLVLAIGTKYSFTKQGPIDNEGYLDTEFKQAFTQTLISRQIIDGTTGPFDDDDYFSGIEDENGQLNYYFEIHNMEQEQVLAV